MKRFTQSQWIYSLLLVLAGAFFIAACAKDTPTGPAETSQKVTGVLQTQEGFTIPQAVIEAYDSKNAKIATDTTDDAGAFSFALDKDPNKINLRISHPD